MTNTLSDDDYRTTNASYQFFMFLTYWFEAAHISIAEVSPVDNANDDGNNDNQSNDHDSWEHNQQNLSCA